MKCKIEVVNKGLTQLYTSMGPVKVINGVGYIDEINEDNFDAFSKEVSKVGKLVKLGDADKIEQPKQEDDNTDGKGISGTQDTMMKFMNANASQQLSLNLHNVKQQLNLIC